MLKKMMYITFFLLISLFSVGANDCWEINRNKNMLGLTTVRDITFTECKESCYNSTVCHSFEYHSKVKICRIQKKAFDVEKAKLVTSVGTNNYILKKRCRISNSTVASEECWVLTNKKYFDNVLLNQASSTLESCKKACLEHKKCRVFKFENEKNKCYMQVTGEFDESENQYYVLNEACHPKNSTSNS